LAKYEINVLNNRERELIKYSGLTFLKFLATYVKNPKDDNANIMKNTTDT